MQVSCASADVSLREHSSQRLAEIVKILAAFTEVSGEKWRIGSLDITGRFRYFECSVVNSTLSCISVTCLGSVGFATFNNGRQHGLVLCCSALHQCSFVDLPAFGFTFGGGFSLNDETF